ELAFLFVEFSFFVADVQHGDDFVFRDGFKLFFSEDPDEELRNRFQQENQRIEDEPQQRKKRAAELGKNDIKSLGQGFRNDFSKHQHDQGHDSDDISDDVTAEESLSHRRRQNRRPDVDDIAPDQNADQQLVRMFFELGNDGGKPSVLFHHGPDAGRGEGSHSRFGGRKEPR